MPYYNPYQTMLVQYSPQSPGRTSSTSAFASGDAVAAGSVMRGGLFQIIAVIVL